MSASYSLDIYELGELGPVEPAPETPKEPNTGLDIFEHLGEHETELALAGGVAGAALGNILPDPSDGVYFAGERYLTTEYKAGRLSEAWLWGGTAFLYYVPCFLWWSAVAYITIKQPGIRPKLVALGTLIGGGAVVGLVLTYILQDQ